jgi:pilus assembly protein CpaB
MSTSTGKRRSALGTVGFMVAAVVFSALAGVMLSQVLQSNYSTDPVRSIVAARVNLKAGAPLRAGDLTLVDWPQSSVPEGAFESVDAVLKTKSVPLVLMVRGEPVLRSHLSRPNTGIGVAGKIERGKRAVSVRTDDPVAVARLLYPGARVDVLSTVRRHDPQGGRKLTTRTVLQNIKVLAVGEDIDPMTAARRRERSKGEDDEGAFGSGQGSGLADSREVRGVVTLLVTPEEAERLSQAARQGKIDVALRNPQDKSITKTRPVVVAATKEPKAQPAPEIDDKQRWGLRLKRRRRRRSRRRRRGLVASGGSAGIRIIQGGR